jgi:hypothetical protein
MPDDVKKPTQEDMHRYFAANLFNLTWELLEKEDRSREDDERMLYAACASRFHWGEIGTPLEFERGESMISYVCAALGKGGPALAHAERCLEICQQNDIADFDIAFAYRDMARALQLQGEDARSQEYIARAEVAAENIAKKGDRDYFLSELAKIKT